MGRPRSSRRCPSGGWFFHDLAGLETVLILRHAARTIELLRGTGEDFLEEAFLEILDTAVSNDKRKGSGRSIWRNHVLSARG